MTRTHAHSAGPAAAQHDRHLQRHSDSTSARSSKKGGGGSHNWGNVDDAVEIAEEDMYLADEAEEETIAQQRRRSSGNVQVMSAEEFTEAHGVDPDTARETSRARDTA
ncbi:hypothetical protein DFS34DRAFT_589417 [Phlyctochytrium arcticum]|nr:hypothetical protein DFS34DRAFT_589417 [Phlyctochytrium arcticum]